MKIATTTWRATKWLEIPIKTWHNRLTLIRNGILGKNLFINKKIIRKLLKENHV